MDTNFYGPKTKLESMSKKQILLFLILAATAYGVIIYCGVHGPMPFQVQHSDCGLHNGCNLNLTMLNQYQLCQKPADSSDTVHDDLKISMIMFISKKFIDDRNKSLMLNFTVQALGTDRDEFYDNCMNQSFQLNDNITKDLTYLKPLNPIKQVIRELSCTQSQMYGNESVYMCSPAETLFLRDIQKINMIKIEFTDFIPYYNENTDQIYSSIMNTKFEIYGRNPYFRKFVGYTSLTFFLVTLYLIYSFSKSVTMIGDSQKGHIQAWIGGLLLGLALYNLPYKILIKHVQLLQLFDATINASFTSAILIANLVILHSLSGGSISSQNMLQFYWPKLVLGFFIWVSFYGYVFSETMSIIQAHLMSNDFKEDSLAILAMQKFFYVVMSFYALYALYFTVKCIRQIIHNHCQSKFAIFALVQSVTITIFIASMLSFPSQNQTMRFMNENGFFNIYLIILSTFMKPDSNQYSDDLKPREDHEIKNKYGKQNDDVEMAEISEREYVSQRIEDEPEMRSNKERQFLNGGDTQPEKIDD